MSALSGVRGRVTFAVLAVTAVVYSLLGAIGFVQIASSGRDAIEQRIEEVLDELETGLTTGLGAVEISTADGVTARAIAPSSPPPAELEGEVQVERLVEISGTEVLLVGRSSQARLTDSLRSLYRALWIAIPIASVISAALAGLATRRALRPVGAITELAEKIGASADGDRVAVPDTGDEIEHLARTVNEMLDRIEHGRAAQRQFTSDAAHELRTPLMALQGELELVGGHVERVDGALLERLTNLSARLGDRIDDLVLLSTLDEGRPLSLVPASLLAIARDEAALLVPDAQISGDDVATPLDRELMGRALRNLLANARRHSVSLVAVVVERTADRVVVHVDDDGAGVPVDRREVMFSRFARLDESRSTDRGGSGLGLAIVATVAQAHGGGVEVTDSPRGGARVSLWIPAHPS
jgi:signal transduction histidine kinase